MKRILTVYLDTSVFGGCFDAEFSLYSQKLVQRIQEGRAYAVFSQVTLQELQDAPERVRRLAIDIPDDNKRFVPITAEIEHLAAQYLLEKAVPKKMRADALHIAVATVERVDVLVSWNFKHIVNLGRIKMFNAVNLKSGYPMIEIRSPREVFDE